MSKVRRSRSSTTAAVRPKSASGFEADPKVLGIFFDRRRACAETSRSPRTTSGAAMAASIALSVLSGSTARQQFVIESDNSRKSACQSSASTSGGETWENSPHKRMNRNRWRKMTPS